MNGYSVYNYGPIIDVEADIEDDRPYTDDEVDAILDLDEMIDDYGDELFPALVQGDDPVFGDDITDWIDWDSIDYE